MKVAIYCRVSTKDQNIQMQLDLCRELCKRGKHEIYEEYIDIGESGKKESRPAFDEMLKAMRRYKFHAICVYKIDRIGRSLPHLINLFEEFTAKSVHFMSATQNIDSSTPEGKMFLRLIMILAEFEREMTVARVNSGIARARREGKTLGRPRKSINYFKVLKLRSDGLSLRNIASELNVSLGAVQRCIERGGTTNG